MSATEPDLAERIAVELAEIDQTFSLIEVRRRKFVAEIRRVLRSSPELAAVREALERIVTGDMGCWTCDCLADQIALAALAALDKIDGGGA